MSNIDIFQNVEQKPEKDDLIIIVMLIVNILSIISSIFNLLVTIYMQNYKSPHGRMLIDLSVLNLIYNMLNLVLYMEITSGTLCQALSFLSLFGFYTTIFYTCCFADTFYRSIKTSLFNNSHKYLRRYIIVCTVLGIGLAVIGVIMKVNDIEEPLELCRCFEADLNFSNFGIPALLSVVFCAVCYISSFRDALERKSLPSIELLFYPIILIISCLPIIVVGLYFGLTKASYLPLSAGALEMVILSSQAFLNALVQAFQLISWRKEMRRSDGEILVKNSLLSAEL